MRKLKAQKMLVVKGTYSRPMFAHLKTIEMWVEYVNATV